MSATVQADLVIVGSGSGNTLINHAWEDRRVVVVEASTFGGTCLNKGCIPTKMFVHAAEVAQSVRDAHRFGVEVDVSTLRTDWPALRDRIFGRIDPISAGGRDYRAQSSHTSLVEGWARFVNRRQVAVALPTGDEVVVTGDQFVIATGSSPSIPPALQGSEHLFHSSDSIMRVEALPESLLVIGGGVVACEFAAIFSALGSRVTQVVRGGTLLGGTDEELRESFGQAAARRWDIRFHTEVQGLSEGEGGVIAHVGNDSLPVSAVLVATGRRPATGDLNAEAAGVELCAEGRVRTDEFGRTTVPGIWALGDARSPWQLKHVANAEVRAVAHNLVNPHDLRPLPTLPIAAAVFSRPQVAYVGLTEKEALERGHVIAVGRQKYADTAYGWALEDSEGWCKVIVDQISGHLLGVHVMGEHAAMVVAPAITAIAAGMHVSDFARGQYWIHPALHEVLENAILNAWPSAA